MVETPTNNDDERGGQLYCLSCQSSISLVMVAIVSSRLSPAAAEPYCLRVANTSDTLVDATEHARELTIRSKNESNDSYDGTVSPTATGDHRIKLDDSPGGQRQLLERSRTSGNAPARPNACGMLAGYGDGDDDIIAIESPEIRHEALKTTLF